MEKIYVSKAGYERLARDIDHLRLEKRREIAELMATARSFGDLTENSEYEAAKQMFTMNELRISELESQLAQSEILDENTVISSDKVYIGATVRVKDLDFDEEETYHIVSTLEADPANGFISTESPVGKGMLGHGAGDEIEIKVPKGILRYRILDITRV